MVWYGMVWYGMVWYKIIPEDLAFWLRGPIQEGYQKSLLSTILVFMWSFGVQCFSGLIQTLGRGSSLALPCFRDSRKRGGPYKVATGNELRNSISSLRPLESRLVFEQVLGLRI